MSPYHWLYLLIGSGTVSLISFAVTIFLDIGCIKKNKKSSRNLILNCLLFLFSLCFFALAIWGYIDIQKQINLLS